MQFNNIKKAINTFTKQRGSVMAEFIVIVGFVLIPLAIGISLLGKYVDNKQKMELAARYSGWERTVWYQKLPSTLKKLGNNINTEKSADKIGYEIENRVFANKNSAIYVAQQTSTVNETPDPMSKSFWIDNSNNAVSIYKNKGTKSKKSAKKNNSFITNTEAKQAEMYGLTAEVTGAFFKLLNIVGGFDIKMTGANTSTVTLTLKKPQFLDKVLKKDIVMSKPYTMLADGWNAAGPAHAKARVQGLVGTSLLDFKAFNKVRDVVAILPMAKEIRSDSLIFGYVDVNAVPKSRLKKYKR